MCALILKIQACSFLILSSTKSLTGNSYNPLTSDCESLTKMKLLPKMKFNKVLRQCSVCSKSAEMFRLKS